jgi:hypothetical protein
MGDHFRRYIFEKPEDAARVKERSEFKSKLADLNAEAHATEIAIKQSLHAQREIARNPEVTKIHERRQSIEVEAELARLKLIRSAVITSRGLAHSNLRPSAWWFRLICPDGLWFRETVDSADYYLEPLQ